MLPKMKKSKNMKNVEISRKIWEICEIFEKSRKKIDKNLIKIWRKVEKSLTNFKKVWKMCRKMGKVPKYEKFEIPSDLQEPQSDKHVKARNLKDSRA